MSTCRSRRVADVRLVIPPAVDLTGAAVPPTDSDNSDIYRGGRRGPGQPREETLAILQDGQTMRRLASSDAELARGESVSAEELAEVIRRRSDGQ